jgi:hypothetical protein
LFLWFLEWPAYALAHGHNPFFSTALFHPTGIDLLSNTSVLAVGIPLAPVTWLFGPIATMNVASTVGPALSALAMFWLLGRWVRWRPAAFVGGLVYGFSPFVLQNLAVDHLMTSVLVLPPLMVACLDDLLVRQRRRPVVAGGVLGLLVVLQFFLGTEILVIVVLAGAAGVVLLLGYGVVGHRRELGERLPHALGGLGVAGGVALVLLAYPLWFALDGPAHLSGLVWPSVVPGKGGIALGNIWDLSFLSRPAVYFYAGYEGPALPQAGYLGLGLLAVVGGGLVVWWRDVRLWFFTGLALVAVALSLGVQNRYWVPWRVLARIPVIQNITVGRFMAVTTLAAAVAVAIVVDRCHGAVAGWLGRPDGSGPAGPPTATRGGRRRETLAALAAGGAALAVAAVATVPLGTAVATNVPLTTQVLRSPPWFTGVAPRLPGGQVVLTYPPPVSGASALGWQAGDALHFALATGTGPESVPSRAGPERAGLAVITDASLLLSPPPPATPGNIEAVRRALAGWRVTVVVVPDPTVLVPRYNRTSSTAAALGYFTAALGRPPRFTADAWVWTDVPSPGRRLAVTAGAVARCMTEPIGPGSRLSVPDCVLAASGR